MAAQLVSWTEGPVLSSRPRPGVLLLTLNRPAARNAVTADMIARLVAALDAASSDASVRAVVISANPEGRAFCAGADLSPGTSGFAPRAKKGPGGSGFSAAAFRDGGGYSTLAALRCTKPVIAAINGAAVGWGLAFPLGCDMRVTCADAKVGFTMTARGLVNESVSSWLLPRLVGAGAAKELVFTARVIPAKHAPAGLFNYVLPTVEEVLPRALALAEECAANAGALAIGLSKALMDAAWECTPEQAMLHESAALHHVNYVCTADVREGISAFLHKRRPVWKHDAWHDLPAAHPFRAPPRDVRPVRHALQQQQEGERERSRL